jgi:hypothetical protein
MSLKFIDSFSHMGTSDEVLDDKWDATASDGNDPAPSVNQILAPATHSLRENSINWITSRQYTLTGDIIIGFAYYLAAAGASDTPILEYLEDDVVTKLLTISLDSTRHLKIKRGATTLATSSTALSLNTWCDIEIKVNIHDSTGSYEVKVDGAAHGGLAATGVDTRNGGTLGVANRFIFNSANNGYDAYIAHCWLADSSGSGVTDFLNTPTARVRIKPVMPSTGDGTYADFTPSSGSNNGDMVAETAADGDTSYNASSTTGHKDTYNYPALSISGNPIKAVQVVPYARKVAAGALTFRPVLRIGATNYFGTSVAGITSTYSYYPEVFQTSPATSAAWTESEINGAQFGLEVVSSSDTIRLSQMPLEVMYLDGGSTTLQKVTQVVVIVGTDEYADEDQPPATSACTGGGTVASGSNPSDGTAISTSSKLHAWIETSSIGGTVYRWAKVGIPYGNPKTPRVLSFGSLTRALSDDKGGFESSAMTILLSDYDRTLRGLHATQTLLNKSITVYVADEATIVAGGNPWKVFRGVVRDFEPENELKYRITIEDPLTLSMSALAQERLVPPTLISVSDGTADQGLRQSPVPVLYGSLSDEDDDDPIGTFEAPFIGTETPAAPNQGLGNLHKHLIGLSACGNVASVFVADPDSGDPPTRRAKVGASLYGVTGGVYVPHQFGWFLSTQYSVEDGERYTFLYIDQHHPAADLARYNRIPITVNVCGRETTGDASGATIDSLPLQFLHFLNTEVAQSVGDADWPAIAARDGYSLFDTSTFTTTDTRSEYRIPGGYKGAFILGHGYKQITLREAIRQFCRSGDFAIGVNRHGQIMISMLDVTATAGTVTFTDQSDILKGSFRINPCLDAVENRVQYVYKRNHLRSLQQVNPVEGSRLPREPYDKDWLSGLQTLDDATEQTALGEVRASQVLELEMVRDSVTAADVAARRLALRKPSNGRAEATFTSTLSKGYGVELGDLIEVTHFQGIGASGWDAQRCQVRRIVDDLDEFTRQLTAWDVDNLLDAVAASDAVQWDGDDVVWDGATVTEFV